MTEDVEIINVEQELKYLEMGVAMEVLRPKKDWKNIVSRIRSAIENRDILISRLEEKLGSRTLDSFVDEHGEGEVTHEGDVRQESLRKL